MTMQKFLFLTALLSILCLACESPLIQEEGRTDTDDDAFVESVPDTVTFTNAEFVYRGDDIGEAVSDAWVVKLYTDMETDPSGAPIGPGVVMQLLLNVRYDEEQDADPQNLKGIYREMYNSGDFSPGTFVSGYMTVIDLPGQSLELADATFYAELEDGSTEMDYDLIDEGVVSVSSDEDGGYALEGILVGKKYTKRYFRWSGNILVKDEVVEQTPNSTLAQDLTDLTFSQGQLQDKGDSFYLMDNSYRCLLLYLADDEVDLTSYRPAGSGQVLRLELLVPWDTDITEDGLPDGTYTMVSRNPDTSLDRDKIVPGVAVPGLPDVFADWKLSGSWFYGLSQGEWTDTYARIDEGTVSVARSDDGGYVITYDLKDCQETPKVISGMTSLAELQIFGQEHTDDPAPQLGDDSYMLDGKEGKFSSVHVSNLGEYICIAATPEGGVADFNAIFQQDEFFYVAVSPLLIGKEFDLMTEDALFTVMSTLNGAFLESVAPSMREEITEGRCIFNYADGKAEVEIRLVMADGTSLQARLSAEDAGIVVNENIFEIGGVEKPVRTAFHLREDGTTAVYLTPAGIEYFDELEITTYYAYLILDDSQCNGKVLDVNDIISAGYADNFNGLVFDSSQTRTSGTVSVTSDPLDPAHFIVVADLDFEGTTLKLRFDGTALDAKMSETVENRIIYEDVTYAISDVTLDETAKESGIYRILMNAGTAGTLIITLPTAFLDGKAHGFSQSPDLYIEFDGKTFSKAEGFSGTVTIGVEGDMMRMEVTNYDNLEITYKGQYERKI